MKEQVWTTKEFLDLILNSEIQESEEVKDRSDLQQEHDEIVAFLKAFDLYAEEKQPVYEESTGSCKEGEPEFNIQYFFRGNFIKKRGKEEVDALLDEFVKTKIIKSPTREQLEEGTHVFLCNFFEDLIELRRRLQKSLDYCFYDGLSRMPILHNTLRSITRRAEKMDSVLLKIIGDKEPVSKTDLMEKYGYPEVGLLTGNKSLEEILAAL